MRKQTILTHEVTYIKLK